MKLYLPIIVIAFYTFFTTALFAQGPGSLFVDAGPDQTIECASGGCVDLTADYLETFETISENYTVSSIPYNPPFAFNGLATQMNPNQDDRWSVVENLPFDFCFFGNLETQFQVGSNGVLRFEVDPGDITNGWSFTQNLPNSTNPTLAEANVFTPVHDIDPSASSTEEIGYEVLGVFPNRVLVVSYYQVPMFSGACNSLLATHMAVFYEFSNVIEIYMQNKPVCPTWNSGNAALGIQNNAGTVAFVPPGRNTSDSPWTATNEAWQFAPIGVPTSEFVWLDSDGNVIGNTPTISVCAPGTYTAQVTYTNTCNGDVVVIQDEVVVTTSASFSVDLGPDISTCSNANIILDASADAPAGATYQWFYEGVSQGPPSAANPTFTVTAPNSGTYLVEVIDPLDPTCAVTDVIEITFLPQPVIATPPNDQFLCDDGSTPGIFDLRQDEPLMLGAQNPSLFEFSYHLSLADAETNTAPIGTPDAYPIVGVSQDIYVRLQDLSGNCFVVTMFTINFAQVTSGPVTPNPYFICDQDENGEEIVNLQSLFTTMILNGQNPLDFNVTYHLSQADADNGVNALPNPYTVNTSPLTIFIRVENEDQPSCFDTSQNFDIVLDTPPSFNPTPSPLIECDDDNDGFYPFDLTQADDDITLGDPTLTVSYHTTEANAINNLNPLIGLYTNDNPYVDEVWARVNSTESSCYSVVRLELLVRNTPEVFTPEPLRLCDYNNPGDGFEVFDLTLSEADVLGSLDPTHYDIYYFVNQGDAIAAGESALDAPPGDFSQAIANPGAYQNQIAFNQTIYVLVVGNALSIDPTTDPVSNGESCYSIVELELIVDPLPVVFQPANYELCDDEIGGSTPNDQLSTFDLTSREDEITGGNATLTVTWYETAADEVADNPILDPTAYQNRTIAPATQPTPQTIYARVTDVRGCKRIVTLTLVVLPNPVANTPDPLEECDNGEDLDDGLASFDLTQRSAQIIGGQTNVTVQYYVTEAEAIAGVPGTEIADPTDYTNAVPFFDSVWARAIRAANPPSVNLACSDVVELLLIVLPLPDAPTASFGDLFFCDEDGTGTAIFDLTQNSPHVIGVQDPSEYIGPNYYTTLGAAQAGIPGTEIPNPGFFTSTSNPQTIWVRLENQSTGCARISSFLLLTGTFPTIFDPVDKEECDDLESGSDTDGVNVFNLTDYNAEITGGNPTYEVFYYETAQDQIDGNAILTPEAYSNTNSPGEQTLFVSVFNNEGCEAQTTLTLRVLPIPQPVTDAEYIACDENNDGTGEFIFSTMDEEIANGETDVIVTYHETQADAFNGVFAIDPDNVYENFTNPQIIWVRVTREVLPPSTSPACFAVVELILRVEPTPVLPLEIPSMVKCAEGDTAVFDFLEPEFLDFLYGTQDPLEHELTFHTTLADAVAGENEIPNPGSYTNLTNPQTIFVRLTNIETECFAVGQFDIEVSTGPSVTPPTSLDVCRDVTMEPGFARFVLSSKDDEITGGVAGVEVRYYETQQDAQNDTNALNALNYVNTVAFLQTLYVRVIDGNTGCFEFTTLFLRVLPNPVVTIPDPLELCDENDPGDGIEQFNLRDAEPQMNLSASWEVWYYVLESDAIEGDITLAIPVVAGEVPYSNETPFFQTVYARVVNTNQELGCFTIVPIDLVVHPLPDATAVIEDLVVCEINNDGIALFNLELRVDEILNGQDPAIHTVTFYRSAAEAEIRLNPIVNTGNFQNTSNPQEIYTGILNNETGCYSGGEQFFLIRVREGASATAPAAPLVACEDVQGSGVGTFDLSSLNAEILNGQDPTVYILTYHESLAQAESGENPIASTTTNYQSPTATIWARVTFPVNDPNEPFPAGCYSVVEVQLEVNPLPVPISFQDSYRLCVDAFGNVLEEEFGADSPPLIDTGLNRPDYEFIWEINGQVQVGEIEGSIVALVGGTYTVTITDAITGCEYTASTTVVLSSPPLTFSAIATSGAFAQSHTIEATATGLGSYVFSLDGGPFQSSGIFVNVSPGSHIITIRDENGCGSVQIEVGIIDYPLFFTPNNDGYNDRWNIIGIASNPTAKIYIFDRHGKLLKQISPTSEGWDGTYNGNPLPSSDYWFRVEYIEEEVQKQFRGHFTLKR